MSRENDLSKLIIGAAIDVHRTLGPGLLESAYEECLCFELDQLGLKFERQFSLPVHYKTVNLDCGYRLDIVVEKCVILELKTVEELAPIHDAQLLTYLLENLATAPWNPAQLQRPSPQRRPETYRQPSLTQIFASLRLCGDYPLENVVSRIDAAPDRRGTG